MWSAPAPGRAAEAMACAVCVASTFSVGAAVDAGCGVFSSFVASGVGVGGSGVGVGGSGVGVGGSGVGVGGTGVAVGGSGVLVGGLVGVRVGTVCRKPRPLGEAHTPDASERSSKATRRTGTTLQDILRRVESFTKPPATPKLALFYA